MEITTKTLINRPTLLLSPCDCIHNRILLRNPSVHHIHFDFYTQELLLKWMRQFYPKSSYRKIDFETRHHHFRLWNYDHYDSDLQCKPLFNPMGICLLLLSWCTVKYRFYGCSFHSLSSIPWDWPLIWNQWSV